MISFFVTMTLRKQDGTRLTPEEIRQHKLDSARRARQIHKEREEAARASVAKGKKEPLKISIKEGKNSRPIDLEAFKPLESTKPCLEPIRRRHSEINLARRRYIWGDDEAFDET